MITPPDQLGTMDYDAWYAMGVARFGQLFVDWRFQCEKCGHVHTPAQAASAGVGEALHGRVCPIGAGGCGYPFEKKRWTTVTNARRGLSGFINVVKDGRSIGRYLRFA